MNSRTFGVMVALALAAMIMLTVLLDFVTAHATPMTEAHYNDPIRYEGLITHSETYGRTRSDLWEGTKVTGVTDFISRGFFLGITFGDFIFEHYQNEEKNRPLGHYWPTYNPWNLLIYNMEAGIPETGWTTGSTALPVSSGSTVLPTKEEMAGVDTIWFNLRWYTMPNDRYSKWGNIYGHLSGVLTRVEEAAPVPEPTTALLFGVGLLGLASHIRGRTSR